MHSSKIQIHKTCVFNNLTYQYFSKLKIFSNVNTLFFKDSQVNTNQLIIKKTSNCQKQHIKGELHR